MMTRKNNVAMRESNNIDHKNVVIIFMGNKISYGQKHFG